MILSRMAKRVVNAQRGVASIEYAIVAVAISAIVAVLFMHDGRMAWLFKWASFHISINMLVADQT